MLQHTVLIVDDCPEDREIYRRYLASDRLHSYTILEEELGEPALALCQKIQPDAILLDFLLPDLDGLEFLAELKQSLTNPPPVIMVTGHGSETVAVQALKNGAQDYLIKGKTTSDSLQLAMRCVIENTQLRQQLHYSQEQFCASTENMLDCFGIYSAIRDAAGKIVDFRIEYVNAAACEAIQMTAVEQIGQKLCETLPANRPSGLFADYCQVVQTGNPLRKESLIYNDVDGQQELTKAFDIHISKWQDGFVASWRDITERKQAEIHHRQLLLEEQAARMEAEAASQAKDEFITIISHDLRSPVNSILGWTKLLQSGNLDAVTTSRALDAIERGATSQARLIEDLLDISRVIRGKLELKIGTVDLISIIESAITTAHPSAVAKNISLNSLLPQDITQICGDPQRFQQVLGNLLSNAIKFTPNQGQIEIKLEQTKTEIQITVSDTGRGISAEFLPHIFERYRQESSSHQTVGLGLGLAISRHIVELHGGTISATSSGEGQGATFMIQLPIFRRFQQV